jgi:glycosyl transferase family 11
MQRVIAHLVGGIGNQLFIYAAAWALAQRTGAELILDVSAFRRDTFYRRTYALAHFNLGEVALRDGASAAEFIHRYYRRLRTTFPSMPHRLGPIIGEHNHLQFDPWMADGSMGIFPTVYVFGFRQNEQYFADQADGLRRKLAFVFEPSMQARAQADEILGCNAVCIHFRQLHQVRSGETRPNMQIRQLSETYYVDAINEMRKRVPDARFFCFGDSLANVDRFFPAGVDKVVPKPTGDEPADIRDLWLMAKCRHFIAANSSFSWWAAWLGSRPDSLVLCPDTRGLENGIAPAKGWVAI